MESSPRAKLKGKTAAQIDAAYRELFHHHPSGETVMADLIRKVRQSRIDCDHPDSNACVYQAAQVALVAYIQNKLEREDNDDRIISGNHGSTSSVSRRHNE